MRRAAAALAGLAAVAALVALGVWQLDRLAWKRALIAQVEARLAAAPVLAPGPERWAAIGADDAYTRVSITGRFLNDRAVRVQAVTALGPGQWLIVPLVSERGFTVLVNRGFLPADGAPRPAQGRVSITGLLRPSEPGGGFLHANYPEAARWYSRDVAAIAREEHLGRVAPYFIDADAGANPGPWPRGGLTVVHFPNHHLQYALTWFAMAALLAITLVRLGRRA